MANGQYGGGMGMFGPMFQAGVSLLGGSTPAQAMQMLGRGQQLEADRRFRAQQAEMARQAQNARFAQQMAMQQAAQNAAAARHQQMMDWRREQFAAGAPEREAQLGLLQARQADLEAQAAARQRQAGNVADMMQRLDIDPQSPEGIALQTTGKLPAAAYKSLEGRRKRAQTGERLAAGLRDIQAKAEAANQAASLESAIGPMQGAEPTSLLGAVPINIARTWGEVTNLLGGGKMSPNQVRSNIAGATEAIAAAIKPLIRGPGEGPWTDADQARLVAMVGNLSQAKTLDAFKQRLNSLRDRVQANFGMDVPFDAYGKTAPTGTLPRMDQFKVRR